MSHNSVSFTDILVKFGTCVQTVTLNWLAKYDLDRIRIPDFCDGLKIHPLNMEIPVKNSYMLYLYLEWSDCFENGEDNTYWHCLLPCQIWSGSDPDCELTDWSNFQMGKSQSSRASFASLTLMHLKAHHMWPWPWLWHWKVKDPDPHKMPNRNYKIQTINFYRNALL